MKQELSDLEPARGLGWRSADQICIAALTAVALGLCVASWVYRGGLQGRLLDIDEAPPATITFQIDVNTADWPEWTMLPSVGEVLAKRIVESRETNGPFRSHQDLLRVHGIGPRTLERLRPFLLPITTPPAVAGT